MTSELNLDSWWNSPAYNTASATFSERGAFILRKLLRHDGARFVEVMADLYRDDVPDPQDITRFEWETILRYLGASPEEIKDVQLRMGRVWR